MRPWPAALYCFTFLLLAGAAFAAEPIDRHALVTRHNVTLTAAAADCPLQVGNGEFAFSADVTGLQTFPEFYELGGIPLCTQAHWAWHSAPAPEGLSRKDLRLAMWDTHGRPVPYPTDAKGQTKLFNWLRENAHMLHLGQVGFALTRRDGKPATIQDIQKIRQRLDLWSGVLTSQFEFEGNPFKVQTCADPARDGLAVRVESPTLGEGSAAVRLAFPYGSPAVGAADWTKPDAHTTALERVETNGARFVRTLDADRYAAALAWTPGAALKETGKHTYTLSAAKGAGVLEFVIAFSPKTDIATTLPAFAEVQAASAAHWKEFWTAGGAIDLSQSKDPRWRELERRIVLSQYVMALNAAGSLPPQESGLVCNSWNGKFHLEMHWWHEAQWALWGRWPLLERSLGFYTRILPKAAELAKSQGYRGLRWPKMTDASGDDSPSAVGPLLIWQQPHPIFYAELDYRLHPTRATLEKWKTIVLGTGEFLASYPDFDKTTGQYVLGPPLKHVSENLDAKITKNTTFELGYWRFGLRTAQVWRERHGLPRDAAWDKVLNGLAPLPVADGAYLTQEGMTDTYTKNNWEHPGQIGVLGMMPGDGADAAMMRATVRKTMAAWKWDRCWGWDFPMTAMAAARSGEPELAIQALLLPSKAKNAYLPNGFNPMSRGKGFIPYFPANGALLYATALMAAGWDGAPDRPAPGFPSDGQWVVRCEGLSKAP